MTGADLLALLKKQPVGAACLLICLLCGVAYYFRGDEVEAARARCDEKTKEDQKTSANVRNAHDLAAQTAAMQAAAKQLESRMVRPGQLANNLQIFYRLESETGVKLLDARQLVPPPAKAGAPKLLHTAVGFTVSMQGNYRQVLDFLGRLERGGSFAHFSAVSISKLNGGEAGAVGPDQLSVNLSLELLGAP